MVTYRSFYPTRRISPQTPRRRRPLLTETSGVAALEFAMVAPIMLLMIIGMLCFGLYFTYIHEIEELAGAGARASIAGLSPVERNSLAQQYVANATANSSFLRQTDLTVSTATSGTPATFYSVTINYNLRDTPIPMLAALIAIPANTITRTCTVQFGGY